MINVMESGIRELAANEIDMVSGSLKWAEGAAMIAGISMFTPATMAFGFPIAAAMILIDRYAG
jgi:hypothetical protein